MRCNNVRFSQSAPCFVARNIRIGIDFVLAQNAWTDERNAANPPRLATGSTIRAGKSYNVVVILFKRSRPCLRPINRYDNVTCCSFTRTAEQKTKPKKILLFNISRRDARNVSHTRNMKMCARRLTVSCRNERFNERPAEPQRRDVVSDNNKRHAERPIL